MRYLIISILITFLGCSANVGYKTAGGYKKTHKKFNSSQNKIEETPVKANVGEVYYFVTSYYGKKFHGRLTSNGETFDMNKLTCAHKTLPFGTKLKVTDDESGRSVVVRVNDRGPFVKGRDLDISRRAAEQIGLIPFGVKKLKVEILE